MKSRVSRERVNAFLCHKQGLVADTQGSDKTQRVFYILGVYGASPSCYLSLLNRSAGASMSDIDTAIYKERRLIRMRCMRGSMFLLSSDDVPVAFQATKQIAQSAFRRIIEKAGVTDKDYRSTVELLSKLTESRSLTVSELGKAIPAEMKAVKRALNYIVAEMCSQGILVRAGVRGGWKSNLFEYTSFNNWAPTIDIDSMPPPEARAALARRYFDAYGPATADDFQWWSGLSKPETDRALAMVGEDLVKLEVEGIKGECLVPRSDTDRLLSRPENLAGNINLLPPWDAYLMAYKGANRTRYLASEYYDQVYDRSGNATYVILTNGVVSGIWDMRVEKKEIHILVSLFKDASKLTWGRIKKKGETIAGWLGFKKAIVFRCPLPDPLNRSPQNRFLSPLDGIAGEPIG